MRRITITVELPDDYADDSPETDVLALTNATLTLEELMELQRDDSRIQIFFKAEDV